MTKEVLEQYIDLKNEISKSRRRLEKFETQSPFVSDIVQNGYKRHAVIKGIDYNRIHKMQKLIDILKELEDKALEQKIQIAEYIKSIERSDIRQIFIHRYIDDMEWYQIAITLGYNNEDAPRKKHDRYLEKNL